MDDPGQTSEQQQQQDQPDMARPSMSSSIGMTPDFDSARQRNASSFGAGGVMAQGNPLSLVQPASASGLQSDTLNNGNSGNANQCECLAG